MSRDEFLKGYPFYYQGNEAVGPYHYQNDRGTPYIALKDNSYFCAISSVRNTHVKLVLTAFGRSVRINVRYEELTMATPTLPFLTTKNVSL